ncbi:MAG: methyltransferase domain-containing protein [Planctomycetes bacterium]|nr:methyltransferase domain-containing protein [Planctomycetota bacterium]
MTDETANPTFYDADSATYDEARWESRGGVFNDRTQQKILRMLCGDWRMGRIVEVGPGTARFSIPLARQENQLTLVDISAEMLETARSKIESAGAGDQIEAYINGSIYELPLPDASFDHAITLNVVNHLERVGDALRELARVLKPGATILFNYANLRSYYWTAGRRINRQGEAIGQNVFSRWLRPADVHRMIDAAGLTLVRRLGHAHVPRNQDRFTPIAATLDAVSRRGPLRGLAPVQYCLCRKD